MHVLRFATRVGLLASGIGIAVAVGILIGALMVKQLLAAEPMPIETPVESMPPAMARAYIVGIQEELAVHGYKPGPADGQLGEGTRRAIRQYQKDAGLPVNGVASKELLEHMKFALPKVDAKAGGVAVVGPSRELVSAVQRQLAARGYYRGEVDGRVGPATREAVRRFQTDAGLPATGAVDQRLSGELSSADPKIRAGAVQSST